MQQRKFSVDIVFVFMLFCVFTLSALFLSVIGADVYARNVDASEGNYNIRTSILYLTEKVRQNEKAGYIRTDTANGEGAIVLTEVYDDVEYETWIYIEDGYLCEVFMGSGMAVSPGIGQKIMPLESLAVDIDDNNLLTLSITDEKGRMYSSNVVLECGIEEVAAP